MNKIHILITAIGLTVGVSHADLLIGFDFNGYAGSELTGTSVVAHVDMQSPAFIERGSGVGVNGNAGRFNGNGWTETSLNDAITDNDYFTWSMDAAPTYQFSVTNIVFNFERSSTGGQDWALRSSADSFTANLTTFTGLDNGSTETVDLSAAGLDDLTTIEFRFYGYNGSSSVGSAGFEGSGNDLVINGTTSLIPEPGTMAMLGAGLAFILAARRRMSR